MNDKLTDQRLAALANAFEWQQIEGGWLTGDGEPVRIGDSYIPVSHSDIITAVSAQTDEVRWAYAHYRLQASIHITRIESSCGSVKVPIEGLFRVLQQDILTQLEALADALIGEE